MKFYRPIDAMNFWYDHSAAAINYGMPGIFVFGEEEIIITDINPENSDYPDWWYIWLDLDMAINKLPKVSWALIFHYYKYIYKGERGIFYRWRKREMFRSYLKIFFDLISDEYKKESPGCLAFSGTIKNIQNEIKEGKINMEDIKPEKNYTVSEVSEYLRLHEVTVRRMLREERLIGFRLAHSWRIPGRAILTLIGMNPKEVC